ncbi:PREDICTED: aspartic proteinase-like protein 2 [Lupinus angustifolius]|uniref:aspartic proteinase-like protein 2 n=1 Tax=Lupinus angustifolius TaxID=3871 RepID=UPI00092FB639|nr:PREDICTED: aspartic proteinase-like protein 2 [Lupinus angustifolius]
MDFNLKGTLLILFILAVEFCLGSNANLVLPVERKFVGPHISLSQIKAHDARRHGRFLATVDIELGGNGLPSKTGLYYTKIGLGSPAKDYYVQVDTGSDVLWVNCEGCTTCPKKSGLGIELHLYDSKGSNTSEIVPCDGDFCHATYGGQISNCKKGKSCPYSIIYGDGGQTTGSFVRDLLTFNRVNGNLQTGPDSSSVVFGCGTNQSGTLGKSEDDALCGIMGFGQSNSSVLSQLAASGKVKKVFSHCLDNIQGGGIFSIGEVVQPKFNRTSLVPKMAHYNVVLKDVEVDGDLLELPLDIFNTGNGRGTIIDSGTTLAYLPPMIHSQIVTKVLARQPTLKLYLVDEEFTCFHYSDKLDDGFPAVKFHFEGISLIAYPHDYMFFYQSDMYCIGWQKSSSQTKDGKELILLGDLVLSNKLVVYDLENMEIGWTDFNCSSSIKVKDEKTKSVYALGAHKLSSASTVLIGTVLPFFLLLIVMITV